MSELSAIHHAAQVIARLSSPIGGDVMALAAVIGEVQGILEQLGIEELNITQSPRKLARHTLETRNV